MQRPWVRATKWAEAGDACSGLLLGARPADLPVFAARIHPVLQEVLLDGHCVLPRRVMLYQRGAEDVVITITDTPQGRVIVMNATSPK